MTQSVAIQTFHTVNEISNQLILKFSRVISTRFAICLPATMIYDNFIQEFEVDIYDTENNVHVIFQNKQITMDLMDSWKVKLNTRSGLSKLLPPKIRWLSLRESIKKPS